MLSIESQYFAHLTFLFKLTINFLIYKSVFILNFSKESKVNYKSK